MNRKDRVRDLNLLLMVLEEIENMGLFREYHFSDRSENGMLNGRLGLAAFNTGLLAARKLNDFFNGISGRPDDIKVDRFGPFPDLSAPLDTNDRKRMDKQLAHLTLPGEQLRFDSLNLDKITLPVWKRAEQFCQFILSNYLNPIEEPDAAIVPEVKRILHYVSSYLARIEGRLPPAPLP